MQLISSAASPFVRKVHVVLHETGQIADVEVLGVKTSPVATAAEVAAANPLGKIPALLRDDAPAIYDSRVITRFLDARAGGKLYPEARIWDVLTLEATADGIMEAAVLMTYERRIRPPEMVFEPWIEAQWAKVARALDTLNDRWMSHLERPRPRIEQVAAIQPDTKRPCVTCAGPLRSRDEWSEAEGQTHIQRVADQSGIQGAATLEIGFIVRDRELILAKSRPARVQLIGCASRQAQSWASILVSIRAVPAFGHINMRNRDTKTRADIG